MGVLAESSWLPKRIVVGEDFSDDARKAGELAAARGPVPVYPHVE